MTTRAESSVFWPGITPAIVQTRNRCNHCNRITPSQPHAPPTPLVYPEYPFQYICADFFHYKGRYYLVSVDRYSNWPIVERATEGANSLINNLRRLFVTFGIPDELSSDGGPEFVASATTKFLVNWGVHHRLSSVAHPHSNCRAEIGVKTIKRMIMNNTGPNGELDTDAFQLAMLTYRNAPSQETKLSPAMCIFGRPIKDFIPILPGKYKPHETWQSTLQHREEALRHRHMKVAERLSEHTKRLQPLVIGNRVRIQNQTGPHPLKWDKTGTVIEVKQFDQYGIRVDGSGRVTLRNRKFLRKYTPMFQPASPAMLRDAYQAPPPSRPDPPIVHQPQPYTTDTPPTTTATEQPVYTPPSNKADKQVTPATVETNQSQVPMQAPPVLPSVPDNAPPMMNPTPQPLRRSTRTKQTPSYYQDFVMALPDSEI